MSDGFVIYWVISVGSCEFYCELLEMLRENDSSKNFIQSGILLMTLCCGKVVCGSKIFGGGTPKNWLNSITKNAKNRLKIGSQQVPKIAWKCSPCWNVSAYVVCKGIHLKNS